MKIKNTVCLAAVVWLTAVVAVQAGTSEPAEKINSLLRDRWETAGLAPIPRADDATFLRRATLTLAGRLPTPREIRDFLRERSPQKRQQAVERLLKSEDFARMLAMRYADMFRIKSEFPINLWPNAVQLYHNYFLDAARRDRPFDAVVRELLTANGSNFRVAPANFFRAAADRSPAGLARATARSLMGIRIERFSEEEQSRLADFFRRIRFKKTGEWKEEIVYDDPEPAELTVGFPGEAPSTIFTATVNPRAVFADRLLNRGDPIFARAFVNRVWHWTFGRGLISPADDIAGPGSASGTAVAPEVLDALTEEFISSGYHVRELYRLILATDAFTADWKCAPEEMSEADRLFAVYPVRRLEAELVADILGNITGASDRYRSVIPEPFTILPADYPAVMLGDGSITSSTLELFGRPSRDTGGLDERNNLINARQRLFLLNSSQLYTRLNRLPQRAAFRKLDRGKRIEEFYLRILARKPLPEEVEIFRRYVEQMPPERRRYAFGDLGWALINSREFLHYF